MNKPNKEEYSFKNNQFPSIDKRIDYEIEYAKYISWKKKENKQKLINEVADTMLENPKQYTDILRECIYNSFKNRKNEKIKTWL